MFMETRAGRLDVMELSPQQYLRRDIGGKSGRSPSTNTAIWPRSTIFWASIWSILSSRIKRYGRPSPAAINRGDIVKGVLLGLGEPAFGPYKPGTWAYHPGLRPVSFNPDRARKLLAEAGFADSDGDGILDKDGRPLAFTILTNQGNEPRILTATIIQSQLRAVGIDVRIRTVEWAAFIREFVNTGRFDAIILGWTITQDPDIFAVWHSSQAVPGA